MSLLPANLLLPQRTVSGADTTLQLAELVNTFGSQGVLVHGQSLQRSGKLQAITKQFNGSTVVNTYCHKGSEPTVHEVDVLRETIKSMKANWVAAIGGGSVMDLAKAAAGLVDHTQKTAYYQVNPSEILPATIPLIAAPTTAGTGSEATVVSVLTNPETMLKQSIRHPSHMPKIVILDPELLKDCPPSTIAAAGLDAFIQAFESYTSRTATPFTQCLAELAIKVISANLLPLFKNPADTDAAAEMLEASYITGVAFSHSRLGIIHGLAHPLGVRFNTAHGLACACCLPAALEYNRDYIKDSLCNLKSRCAIDIEDLVTTWMSAMKLANPFSGKSVKDMDSFIKETLASGSTKANPRDVTADDVRWLLDRIMKEDA
ncbi:MAG: iron-containing alcohol dehydrogenase [Kiritimatiellae bacterium]|jgi:alcohol dehydrogenase class IV|nr:iron-containing alcohol dehydrogenase [Kiritimatiellia bacterium]